MLFAYIIEAKEVIYMTQKTLSKLAKVIILLFCLLGIAFYGVAVPFGGRELLADVPICNTATFRD